jgi:hypothetical protein
MVENNFYLLTLTFGVLLSCMIPTILSMSDQFLAVYQLLTFAIFTHSGYACIIKNYSFACYMMAVMEHVSFIFVIFQKDSVAFEFFSLIVWCCYGITCMFIAYIFIKRQTQDAPNEEQTQHTVSNVNFSRRSPTVTYNSEDCTICLEPLNAHQIQTTVCGHVFHNDCIRRWLSQRNTCPVCCTEQTYEV